MAFGEFFLGTPQRIEELPRFSPEQQAALSTLLPQAMARLRDPYAGFDPIEKRARTQFAQQTIPSLAERFTALGSNLPGALAPQLGQAASGLEEKLAAMRSQYGMQQQSQLMNLLNLALTPQMERFHTAAQPGLAQTILPALGRMGTTALMAGWSAIPAALLGSGLMEAAVGSGNALSSLFQN